MLITKLILQKYAQQGKVTLSLAVECKLQFSNNELFDLTMNSKDLQAAITKLNFDLNSECLDINLPKTCEKEIHFIFYSN